MRGFIAAASAAFLAFCCAPALASTTGVVRGTVSIEGVPAAGVPLTLEGDGTVLRTVSQSQGGFIFVRVPFGTYSITAHESTRGDVSAQVDVQSNSVATVALDLRTGKVIGRVNASSARGPGQSPVGVNTLSRAQIATMPNNQSLASLIATMPGIVTFSYNEPVAHGFHGISYELDGIPVPQGTASNFSEIIDPRTIDSLEVITGAFPAEYGGFRQGAAVNIISHRPADLTAPEQGYVTLGAGNFSSAQASIAEAVTAGKTRVFFNANTESTGRGLDSPTFDPQHNDSSQTNAFLRTLTNIGRSDVLAFSGSTNTALFQIPINTQATIQSPVAVPPSTADVQREYDTFFNLSYTLNSPDGHAYTQIAPWYHYNRIAYDGDIENNVQGTFTDFTTDPPTVTPLNGLRSDRRSTFTGLRLVHFESLGAHALKAGVDQIIENFSGTSQITYYDATGALKTFDDNAAQRGTLFDAYVQDKWNPNPYVSIFGGVRYDHSTGYVSGNQVSPRLEFNGRVDPQTIVHAYVGTLYAAPFLEDTRRSAVVIGGGDTGALPVYDLRPEHDAYYEFGIAHQLTPIARAYVNFWKRDVTNVLDTTQIFPTPIFAVYNNAIGVAKGVEGRVDAHWPSGDSLFFSAALSNSQAGGISGGTFLFCPTPSVGCLSGISDVTLNPEDHDQAFAATFNYTKRFGGAKAFFATLQPQYGTGYPVQFQNGLERLPPYLTWNLAAGREAGAGKRPSPGFLVNVTNLTNHAYLIKVNNGFNTTQWAAGTRVSLRLTLPF